MMNIPAAWDSAERGEAVATSRPHESIQTDERERSPDLARLAPVTVIRPLNVHVFATIFGVAVDVGEPRPPARGARRAASSGHRVNEGETRLVAGTNRGRGERIYP
eukprot:4095468-Pyramimonas_sp.AAC.1